MNYMEWGHQYLEEAGRIKERIDWIHTHVKGLSNDEQMQALRRADILYDMYLECRHTGKFLQGKDRGNHENKKVQL